MIALRQSLKGTMKNYGMHGHKLTESWKLQYTFECCGVNGYKDWKDDNKTIFGEKSF